MLLVDRINGALLYGGQCFVGGHFGFMPFVCHQLHGSGQQADTGQ